MGRIKGTAVLSVVKALKVLGKERVAAEAPPAVAHYLDERILPSSWYSEDDHLALLRLLGRLIQTSLSEQQEDVFVWMGRNSAQTDMSTVYSSLVSTASPETAFRRGGTLWQAYHDSGSLQITMTGPSKGTAELTDYPGSAPEVCRVLTGWLAGFVQTAGGKDVKVRETRCKHRGAMSCIWEVEWS